MTMIEQELGRPWQQVYSQLTPRPIAAASLGQVRTLARAATYGHACWTMEQPLCLENRGCICRCHRVHVWRMHAWLWLLCIYLSSEHQCKELLCLQMTAAAAAAALLCHLILSKVMRLP